MESKILDALIRLELAVTKFQESFTTDNLNELADAQDQAREAIKEAQI